MSAKEYLLKIRDTNSIVQSYEDEIEILYSRLESVTAKQKDVNVQNSKEDRTPEIISKIIELKEGIVSFINELVERRKEADAMVRELEDYRYQTVIIKYYFQSKTLEQTAVEMGISYQWLCELRDRALEDFEKVLKKHKKV